MAALAPPVPYDDGDEYGDGFGEAEVIARNFRMLRDVAHAPAEPGAPATRADTVWSRREGAAWVGQNED